jgi:hypothetical protein
MERKARAANPSRERRNKTAKKDRAAQLAKKKLSPTNWPKAVETELEQQCASEIGPFVEDCDLLEDCDHDSWDW